MHSKPVIPFLCLSAALLSACVSIPPDFSKEPEIIRNPNGSTPLSALLHLETEKEYDGIEISLKSEDHKHTLSYAWTEKQEYGFPLLMVHADSDYSIRFKLLKGKKTAFRYRENLIWHTPEIPADAMEFPGIEVKIEVFSDMARGYTILNPRRRIPLDRPGSNELNKSFGMLLAVDHSGEVVWYYRTDSRISDFDLLPDNKISYLTQDSRITIIDFLGNTLQSWYASDRPEGIIESSTPVDAMVFHHDVNLLPNGNRVVLSAEYREIPDYYTDERQENAPRKTQKVMGDVVLEFAPDGKVVWEWHAFDFMDPYRIGYETFSMYWYRRGYPGVIDWSHANAVIYDEEDDAFILNFRYQSALMKISRKSKEIEWIFGEPSGWSEQLRNKLITLDDASHWFWHQHSPSITPNGNLILFNNDNYGARPFDKTIEMGAAASNVIEFKIDEEHLTACRIWSSESETQEKVLSIAMGDVDCLSNGNILAAYGALLPLDRVGEMTWWNRGSFPQWTMIREFKHSQPAELLWELRLSSKDPEISVGWTLFGAERFKLQ